MTRAPAALAGVAGWAGLAGADVRLAGDVVVVSPHLDDAVFSLGATIARATGSGARVTSLTGWQAIPSYRRRRRLGSTRRISNGWRRSTCPP